MADAELAEPERPQCGLGRVHRLQAAQGDRRAVGQPGGEAGRCGLVPGAQAELLGPMADVVLGEAGLHQGERRAGRGRGGLPGAVIPQVADIDPEHDVRRLAHGPAVPGPYISAVLQRAQRSAPLAT